ncbi:MAG TPA: SDR family NAD(P)-dependent oxidoreductase [Steroidobacteraceae bacterium]|jgi:NAD(P)-dependent dehydrogenase (short-subunit alcohol dehydrogenase family)|nr:SDR family NAD(P)-dependent oxidoreductase [Steroidobacteraceae bacterium]
MPELRFDQRVAVITGAGRGLGRAYALLMASKGARVVVNDPGGSLRGQGVDAGPAADVVREIKSAGGEAVANTDSVATPEGGKAIVQAALDHYGRLDALIHNAGIVRPGSLQEMSQADFDNVVDVHLNGAFHLVRAAFPIMFQARYGRIVLTSSIGGIYGNHRIANYAVSKAGVIGLSNVAALEGESANVKCNVILPSAVTRMAEGIDISAYPPMDPELVAPVVGWLAHENCSINGEMLASIAGRIARAYIVESQGIYQPSWTIDQVDQQIDAIRTAGTPWELPVVPHGHIDHIRRSFAMAVEGKKSGSGKTPSSH